MPGGKWADTPLGAEAVITGGRSSVIRLPGATGSGVGCRCDHAEPG